MSTGGTRVVGLGGDDLEALHERQAGVDHHRELAGEDAGGPWS